MTLGCRNLYRMRWTVPIFVVPAVGLAAIAGCGSDPGGESNESVPRVEVLNAALVEASAASSFRASVSLGMDMSIMGQEMLLVADPEQPLTVIEVDADGETYTEVDMAPMMNALTSSFGNGDADAFSDDLGMQIWESDGEMVVDLGDIGPLMQAGGTAADIPAGPFTVDLTQLDDGITARDTAVQLSGQAAPDPTAIAEMLRDHLSAVVDVDGDPNHFTGTMSLQDYAAVDGGDPDEMFAGLDTDMLGAESVGELEAMFSDITVHVDVELADQGSVDTVEMTMDMAPLIEAMFASMGDASMGADAMSGDMRYIVTILTNFDIDDSIDVEVPSGDFPDHTDEFIEMSQGG